MRDCPTSREERDVDQLQQLLNLEEEQTHLLMNTQNSTIENPRKTFKLMNGTTAFLPLDSNIGGQKEYNSSCIGQFLTREQANYVYKMTELGEVIDVDTMQQETEQEEQLNKIDNMSGETNPYKKLTVNNAEKIEPLMTQMEHWSILSNILNYMQLDRHHMISHNLSIRAVNKYKNSSEPKEERETTELDFGVMRKILCK